MEHAGRNIEDSDLKTAISGKGLGTPATRAEIIKSLEKDGYAERNRRYIQPTKLGEDLIAIVDDRLKDPVLTAEWEQELQWIAEGKSSTKDFLGKIEIFVSSRIRALRAKQGTDEVHRFSPQTHSERIPLGKCPRCGKMVYENAKGFCCEDRSCGFSIWKDNQFSRQFKKTFTAKHVGQFLQGRKVHFSGLTAKSGTKFDADVRMKDTGKYVNFDLVFKE